LVLTDATTTAIFAHVLDATVLEPIHTFPAAAQSLLQRLQMQRR